jgi:hypothetical protein
VCAGKTADGHAIVGEGMAHISGLVAHGCIIQVTCNGNLQIEMHSFASQQLP